MRHNHKNHIGSTCRFVFDVLPNWKNRNPHRSPKSEKLRCFCQKNENQMLKKRKAGNHNGQQNQKTEVFHCKNRKTDLENCQIRTTENPNAPLLIANLINKFVRNVLQKRYGPCLFYVKVWLLIDKGISTFVKNMHFPATRFSVGWTHTSHITHPAAVNL